MRYVVIIILIIISIYPFSYARFNWDRKNRLGAVAAAILAVAAIVFPAFLLLTK